mgnify:FL=1
MTRACGQPDYNPFPSYNETTTKPVEKGCKTVGVLGVISTTCACYGDYCNTVSSAGNVKNSIALLSLAVAAGLGFRY